MPCGRAAERPESACLPMSALLSPSHLVVLLLQMLATTTVADGVLFPAAVRVARDGTSPTELWAATKLAELLSLPLVRQQPSRKEESFVHDSSDDGGGDAILVGWGAATTWGGVAPATLSALRGDDSYLISVTDDGATVVIAAPQTSRRGSMNGIYAYLRALGFLFLTTNSTVVPKKPWGPPDGWLGAVHTFTPPLEYRDMDTSTAADLGRRHFVGSRAAQNFSIVWPPSNYSAALGLDGFFAFPPIPGGKQVSVVAAVTPPQPLTVSAGGCGVLSLADIVRGRRKQTGDGEASRMEGGRDTWQQPTTYCARASSRTQATAQAQGRTTHTHTIRLACLPTDRIQIGSCASQLTATVLCVQRTTRARWSR
eukprot:COSAG02_NODE_536_length_20657_cov_91.744041_15_plen_369_part_00